jgi:hypothetical protein
MQAIREMLTRLGVMAAHPGAFAILIVYAVLWLTFDRKSFDWHAAATLIVWYDAPNPTRRASRHPSSAGEAG